MNKVSSENDDQLFRLVKTMTSSEKSYFKKFASFHAVGGKNKYVKLFDLIDKSDNYSSQKIRVALGNISVASFNVAKGYLYEAVLKSISSYRADTTIDLQIKKHTNFAEILFSKGLYDLSERMLQKAEKMAVEYGVNFLLVQIYGLQTKIIQTKTFKKATYQEVNELMKKQTANVLRIKKNVAYHQLNTRFYYKQLKSRFIRKPDEINKVYKDILENPLMTNEENAESFQDKMYLYFTKALYAVLVNDYHTAQTYNQKQLNLINAYPKLNMGKQERFLSILFNIILCAINLNKVSEVQLLFHQLEQFEAESVSAKKLKFIYSHLLKLEFFNKTSELHLAFKTIIEFEEEAKNYSHISDYYLFHFYIFSANIYFKRGDYKKAIRYLNKIINNPSDNALIDIQTFARILNLIIHFEMRSEDTLSQLILSLYRFLMKKERLFEFENIFLKYLKKLKKLTSQIALKNMFTQFKNEIVLLQNDPYEKNAFKYIDFIDWLDSNLKKFR